MHVIAICSSHSIGRELAENRARLCMLGLVTLQESWPVGGWVFRLFVSVLERLKSRLAQETQTRPASSEHLSAPSMRPRQPVFENASTAQPPENYGDTFSSPSWYDRNLTDLQMSLQREAETMETRHLIPDVFAFGDGFQGGALHQGEFFDMLNMPTSNFFEL
jgi:hypothetical protein